MICPKCGEQIADGTYYCPFCGQKTDETVRQASLEESAGQAAAQTSASPELTYGSDPYGTSPKPETQSSAWPYSTVTKVSYGSGSSEYDISGTYHSDGMNYTNRLNEPEKTNGPAVAGFVLGIVGLTVPFLQIASLFGLIFSAIGLSKTRDGSEKGHGLAIAGLVLSIIAVVMCFATCVACASFIGNLNEW